jgi:hypothetical protein
MTKASKYSEKLAAEICKRLSSGEPLRAICRDAHMPHWNSVYNWKEARPEFAVRIARARDIGFDAIAEEALSIADTPVAGIKKEKSKDGTKTITEDMLGHRKLQVETRLKLLAKWSPQRYGDRQAIDMTGSLALKDMSEEDIKAELASLIAAGVHNAKPE